MSVTVESFTAKWAASGAAERANKDAYLLELCELLDVPRPDPTTGDDEKDTYVFEKSAPLTHEGDVTTVGKIDLYKAGCFILEAKQGSESGGKKVGTARRGSPAWHQAMKDAYGQALGYARAFDKAVPFLVVVDIGHCFELYAAFDGSWDYRPFPNAQHNRLFNRDLAKHVTLLRQLFVDPRSLDPAKQAAKITKEVAVHLAELAKALEAAGHPQELVATFLMRCLFTMFAEDVGLLPEGCFTKAIRDFWLPSPRSFPGGIEQLWTKMNTGGEMFGIVGKILQFNGGLFANPTSLPLDEGALKLLLRAAECNWAEVEPAIFGTLLERALDPKERHALGAHFTPRAYVERLVRPTIEEPLRAEWDIVQAQVRSLVKEAEVAKTEKAEKAKYAEAVTAVTEFQNRLASIRVLDPACGSGNFLYVTLDLFKRLESEVLSLRDSLGQTTLLHLETIRVTPAQFHGIEIKRWAKEIAELVLWIGYLQWHFRIHGKTLPVPEPVLRDYKNIECRDAVLAYDGEPGLLRDDKGKPVSRWDGETCRKSPVTGEDIPDEKAQVPVYTYKSPRKAVWPEADFIVGNPPYLGARRIRPSLGDGYVDSLRLAFPELPETADLVMYWWHNAALAVENGPTQAFGLLTTNSIVQEYSRPVLDHHLQAENGVRLRFAIADHPWVESADGAAVRVAMTVGVSSTRGITAGARLGKIVSEDDESGDVCVDVRLVARINSSLSGGVAVRNLTPLRANRNICFQGIVPSGEGFKLTAEDVQQLCGKGPPPRTIRPYVIGRDLVQRPKARFIIDFFGLSEEEARKQCPKLYQHLLDRVRGEREAKRGGTKDSQEYARNWWVFAKTRPTMRAALSGLRHFIATPYTAKFRPFVVVPGETLPDAMAYAIASDDGFVLGVLSSRIHVGWALAAGGRLGVGNDPRYTSNATFAPFPFPAAIEGKQKRIREIATSLDSHRKSRQRAHPDLTITGMYNVLEKLRSGEPLTVKEKVIHEQGLVSVLRKLHDDLDNAVFDAYGWPNDLTDEQILERLVALNAERAEEERRGLVRWLRPDFQNPSGAKSMTQTALVETEGDEEEESTPKAGVASTWPKKLPDQIAAVRDLVTKGQADWTLAQVVAAFKGAKGPNVEAVLDSLAALGLVVTFKRKGVQHWKGARLRS